MPRPLERHRLCDRAECDHVQVPYGLNEKAFARENAKLGEISC
jgi:hypothetical protein